ncbi:urea carboxylase-associated family protein [Actinocorallia sp. B10E7]|uniref:urea carboxylase-associated family protein n=1 Tax=Actinocorallia sp. B10E7 TaxID=3153558 RepID=UPI00325CABA2
MTITDVLIPAEEGRGVRVAAGQLLDLIDLEGSQVADLVAYDAAKPEEEYLSPAHTAAVNTSVLLKVGQSLYSNHRNPLLTIVRDDVGRHDIVVPCCDPERYEYSYGVKGHRSCLDNLFQARDLLGLDLTVRGENAWNVFMHNRVTETGEVVTDPALHPAGSTITMRAERDLIVLVSACPQDLSPCNNYDPTSMRLVVRDAEDER